MAETTLTVEEKARVRHHLGYPSVSPVGSIPLGVPAVDQSGFLVDLNMNQLRPEAVHTVLLTLSRCEAAESEMDEARCRLRASSVDGVKLNDSEMSQRREDYTWWCQRLASDIGAPLNPYAPQFAHIRGPRLNARVVG